MNENIQCKLKKIWFIHGFLHRFFIFPFLSISPSVPFLLSLLRLCRDFSLLLFVDFSTDLASKTTKSVCSVLRLRENWRERKNAIIRNPYLHTGARTSESFFLCAPFSAAIVSIMRCFLCSFCVFIRWISFSQSILQRSKRLNVEQKRKII